MQLLTLGLNHATAGLALREKMAFDGKGLQQALSDLRRKFASLVTESTILSTCNRTEVYCAVPEPASARAALVDWLASGHALAATDLCASLYALPRQDAVRHAFRVASGLDSMVLGESQILGQMKRAVREAQEAGALGTHLHHLFKCSFAVAKEVRTRTAIGSGSVSLAAAAVRFARHLFGDLGKTRVLFVGAGDIIGTAAAHFAAQRPSEIAIANRSPERVERLCREHQARRVNWAELPEQFGRFDIVVSGTSSAVPVIERDVVERSMRTRERRPLYLADLAVPRDIAPDVAGLPGVFLHTVDDLGDLARAGVRSRCAAVKQAEAIIETRVDSFMRWMEARRTVPVIHTLEQRAETLRAAELDRAQRMAARGVPLATVLEALADGLVNKFLHGPRVILGRGELDPNQAQALVDQWLPPQRRTSGRNWATARDRGG